MGIEIILNDSNTFSIREMHINQIFDDLCPILLGAPVGDSYTTQLTPGAKSMKRLAVPLRVRTHSRNVRSAQAS